MLYTPNQIKAWQVDTEASKGVWIPCRPVNLFFWSRFSEAWGVLTGKYDVLKWGGGQ